MMKITKTTVVKNHRISHTPVSLVWEGDTEDRTPVMTHMHINDAVQYLIRRVLAPKYDRSTHTLRGIAWKETGVISFGHLSWSTYKNGGTIYLSSPTGSNILTIKYETADE